MYQIDERVFNARKAQFLDLAHKRQTERDYGTQDISFSAGFLRSEEWYKRNVCKKAQDILGVPSWNEGMIGKGTISERIKTVLHLRGVSETDPNWEQNILDWREKQHLEQYLDAATEDIETAIYLLFTGTTEEDDRRNFNDLADMIGRRYPIISFLLFIKDSGKYMPMKPQLFDERFKLLGITTSCTDYCTWANYIEYMDILRDVQSRISASFSGSVELVDAHSFVWMMWHLKDESLEASDHEAVSLLRDKTGMRLDALIRDFLDHIKEHRASDEILDALRRQFVSDYNVQKIMKMEKDEYVIGLQKEDTFCYRIEQELAPLGNMIGANASKFGLYYGKSGNDTEMKYRCTREFGTDPDEAMAKIREQLIHLIIAGNNRDYAAIRECSFGTIYRGKILATYYPAFFLPVFSVEHLDYFLERLGIEYSEQDDILDKQKRLMDWRSAKPEIRTLSNSLFVRFLYESFGRPLDNPDTDFQAERDKAYPREYSRDVKISVEDWKAMLKDEEVFRPSDIELLKRFYRADNHAATCFDLGIQDGKHPSSYISPVVALAQRVSDWAGLAPIYRDTGERVWWRVLFLGRYREDSYFEWKLQIGLAKAMKAVFPELDAEAVNSTADDQLVNDLRNASLVGQDDDFEYEDGSLPRLAAVLAAGHTAYPRDRQRAVNALAHAHFLCEIDAEHPTFIRRASDKPYTEPHHLIPMSYQGNFKVSIDREQNIVSLCSNCHNEIHYGRNAAELVKKLYEKRKADLERIGVKISLGRLLEMYGLQEAPNGD